MKPVRNDVPFEVGIVVAGTVVGEFAVEFEVEVAVAVEARGG